MNPFSPRAGLVGKMPTHGDFLCRGPALAQRRLLDDWLAAMVADAMARHGGDFPRLYDMAPPWRFFGAGADGPVAGALIASADSVGRRFPLLIWAAAADAEDAAAIEQLGYDGFAGGWDADRLHHALAGHAAGGAPSMGEPGRWWIEDSQATIVARRDTAGLADLPSDLIAQMLDIAHTAAADAGMGGSDGPPPAAGTKEPDHAL